MSEKETNTVTISINEYFDLRSRAEANIYLSNELGRYEGRLAELDRRLYELEKALKEREKE